MKLGSKITLSTTLLVTAALAVYGWINVTVRRDDLLGEMERAVRTQGTALQEAIEQAMRTERSEEEIRRLVERLAVAERTLTVTVFNRKGTPLLPPTAQLPEGPLPASASSRHERDIEDWNRVRYVVESGHAADSRDRSGRPSYSFYFPVFEPSGEVAGAVRVTRAAGYLEAYVKATRDRLAVALAALALGLAAAVWLALRQALGRPIAWLVDGIENVARGDLDYALATNRSDEIGAIAARFNAMTAQLKRAREEIVQANHDRLEAERRLRQSEKLAAIGQLAAQLAHEVGTPLNVIGGRARNLVKKCDDPAVVEKNATIIAEQADRITKIIRQLLDVARRRSVELATVSLSEVAESTLAFLSEELQRQQVSSQLTIEGDSTGQPATGEGAPVVVGDADGLTQVVLNLCMNALQSMPHGGKLSLSLGHVVRRKQGLDHTPEVPHVVLEVADTGVGIADDFKDKIFEPFFTLRLPSAGEKEASGTGLGLPIALGIVKEHDGWLEFESEVNVGSRFRVFLPASESTDKALPRATPHAAPKLAGAEAAPEVAPATVAESPKSVPVVTALGPAVSEGP